MAQSKARLAAQFLLTLLLVLLGSLVVLCLTTLGAIRFLDATSPGWSEGPLSLFNPLGLAMLVTPLIVIAILGFLVHWRVRFTEFFLVAIAFTYILAVVPDMVAAPLLHKWTDDWVPVWLAPHVDYPVLVVTPGQQTGSYNAQVIRHSELADFHRRNPDCSFLVPFGQYDRLRAQVPSESQQYMRAHPGAHPATSAYFWPQDLGDGRQELFVSITPPPITTRYDAEAHEIHPKYVKTSEVYQAYNKASRILILLLDVGVLAFYLRWRWKKWRRQQLSAQPATAGSS